MDAEAAAAIHSHLPVEGAAVDAQSKWDIFRFIYFFINFNKTQHSKILTSVAGSLLRSFTSSVMKCSSKTSHPELIPGPRSGAAAAGEEHLRDALAALHCASAGFIVLRVELLSRPSSE